MSGHDILEIVRIVAVIALVCIAAALATPKGRLPLALRGLARILRQDHPSAPSAPAAPAPVPAGRRVLAFALVLLAILICLVI